MAHWKVVGVFFDHMHMGDLLLAVHQHENAKIVGVCDHDSNRVKDAVARFDLRPDQVFTDVEECFRSTLPDLVILCPTTAEHANAITEISRYGVDILIEKPFAANLADADQILNAVSTSGIREPSEMLPKSIFTMGTAVHYTHLAEKVEVSDEEVQLQKPTSWWYKASRGGGSLLDYLGYGATLGTWFMNGRAPLSVTTVVSSGDGIEVDEHSITVCRYNTGLSKLETRWGTFTDPWTLQPQPKCGFVVVGTGGTISSYDFEPYIGVQTRQKREITPVPVDTIEFPNRNAVEYVLHCKEIGKRVDGPLDPLLCRTAQRIIDTAVESARLQRTLELLD